MKYRVLLVMPDDEQVSYVYDDLESAKADFDLQLETHADSLEYIQIERVIEDD
jgi:hypothetical protein